MYSACFYILLCLIDFEVTDHVSAEAFSLLQGKTSGKKSFNSYLCA